MSSVRNKVFKLGGRLARQIAQGSSGWGCLILLLRPVASCRTPVTVRFLLVTVLTQCLKHEGSRWYRLQGRGFKFW